MFHENLEPEEQETFVYYSKSMKDLAAVFRVAKEDQRNSSGVRIKKRKKEEDRENELRQTIFGIG